MALTSKSSLLQLNKISGGIPAIIPIAPKGKSLTNLNSVSGGVPVFALGAFNFNGHVNVNGTWKSLTGGYINVNGTWKELDVLHTNVNGSYKT